MALSGWIVAFVVLFGLLHVLLYLAYSRSENGQSTALSSVDSRGVQNRPVPEADGSGGDESRATPPERSVELEGDTVECPSCGAMNRADSCYTYCWNCISRVHQ